ncbi:MAG: NAD-dependent DNA ligase LigA [Candidatus Hodarchaeota archaeon]
MNDPKKRIKELEQQIRYHNEKYWLENKPEISDEEYDLLKEELKKLDPTNPVLFEIAPIDLSNVGSKVKHSIPMLSLDKAYSVVEVMKWAAKVRSGAVVSPKLDGLAVNLKYGEKGLLLQCSTRGNGRIGEDITAAAMVIKDIPKRLPADDCPLNIRGEIYMRRSVFNKFAEEAASPRNLAAGTVKQKNIDIIRERSLSFAAYDVFKEDGGNKWKTELEKRDFLEQQQVPTIETKAITISAEKIEKIYRKYHTLRENQEIDYDIDGLVLKVLDTAEQQTMGETRHHPRYAIALKFTAKSAQTTVENLEWSAGRTGKLTPVIILKPVFVADAEIKQASLHNLDIFDDLKIAPGDVVEVTRRGDIIPQIERVIDRSGKTPFFPPTHCPDCGEPVFEERPFLVCKNKNCKGMQLERLRYFVSSMEIKGIGKEWIEKLFDEGLVREPADFFKLSQDQLLKLPRMASKSAKNFISAIKEKKTVPLNIFLQALGIPSLGVAAAEILAEKFETLETILSLKPEDLINIEGFGEITAQNIVEGLKEQEVEITNLLQEIHIGESLVVVPTDNPIANKTWCFTGKLIYYSRKEAEELVKSYGGKVTSTITKNLDTLVVGEKPGSKLEKAQNLRIKIMTEKEFRELVSLSQEQKGEEKNSPKPKKKSGLDKFLG